MFVVGLTGGIGSGKTAVSDYFATKGVTIVDADVAARIVVEPGSLALNSIRDHFGEEILNDDGSLNRGALRKVIFSDAGERGWLEKLLHPLIYQEIKKQLKAATGPYAMLVSPLLVETGQSRLTNRIIVVDVPEKIQVERVTLRDSNDEAQVKAIMAAQTSREKRLASASDVITNDASLEALHQQVDQLHDKFIELASTSRT
ncbi:dephospho-CoA kinase [Aurantivibrio plasticivorans]